MQICRCRICNTVRLCWALLLRHTQLSMAETSPILDGRVGSLVNPGRNKRPSPFLKRLPLRYPFPLGGHWRNGYEPAIRILLQDIAFFFFFCVVVGGGVCRRDRRKTLQNVGSSGQHTHTQPNQQQQRNPFFLVVIEQPMCFDQGHHF